MSYTKRVEQRLEKANEQSGSQFQQARAKGMTMDAEAYRDRTFSRVHVLVILGIGVACAVLLALCIGPNFARSAQQAKMPFSQVEASTSLTINYYGSYSLGGLTDGDPATAWAEGAGNSGEGQTVTFSDQQVKHIAQISVMGGYCKSQEAYQDNNRPKKITVTVQPSGREYSFELKDAYRQSQTFSLDAQEAESVTLRIDSVYPGLRYQDCAISEVAFA